MTEDEWYETYKPIQNNLDDNASWNGTMFETYGDELEFVDNQPDENVWTWTDGDDGGTYLSSGKSYINRLGYFVCTVPWTEEAISITVDEPEEYFAWLCDDCGKTKMREYEGEGCECEVDASDLRFYNIFFYLGKI